VSAMRLERCGGAPKITAFPIAARFDPQHSQVQGARETTEFRRQLAQKRAVATANSGHSSRTLNFLICGHWNDLRGIEGIALEPHRHSARKLQFPLNRLEARLFAQGVQERVGLDVL